MMLYYFKLVPHTRQCTMYALTNVRIHLPCCQKQCVNLSDIWNDKKTSIVLDKMKKKAWLFMLFNCNCHAVRNFPTLLCIVADIKVPLCGSYLLAVVINIAYLLIMSGGSGRMSNQHPMLIIPKIAQVCTAEYILHLYFIC